MNKLPLVKRIEIIKMLTEGCSIRSTSRMTEVHTDTIMRLLEEVGEAVAQYQHTHIRNLKCRRIEMDELWSYCYCREKNLETAKAAPEGSGDVWLWLALCADSRLIISWATGERSAIMARKFVKNVADRVPGKVQISTDGFVGYINAVESAFGSRADFGTLIKHYQKVGKQERFIESEKRVISGAPDHISTSYVERVNLTTRMSVRRLNRRTNAFSKRLRNHDLAIGLHAMVYNYCRVHKTLRVTPAMQSGITDHIWTIQEVLALVKEKPSKKRGPYKKKISN